LINIALNTLRILAYFLTQPMIVVFFLILAVGLYMQNRRITVMQQMIIGEQLNSAFELTLSQIVIGLLAGIFLSLAATFLGVMFNENSPLGILFLISIVFMIIQTKYAGFAYSGAVIGMCSVILTLVSQAFNGAVVNFAGININMSTINIFKIDIASLMTLVGLIHIVEGILIVLDGKAGSIPVFTNRGGRIIGGFAFRRYWMFPVVILIMYSSAGPEVTGNLISTPSWWPIVKASVPLDIIQKAVLYLAPFFGICGFSNITFSRGKSEKVLVTGSAYIVYGILLTIFSQFADTDILSQILVIIFSVAAFEFMIRSEEYMELTKKPKFISDDEGIMILAVAPNSPAEEMGIKSGDKLVEINNEKIETEKDILSGLDMRSFIWIKVKREKGNYEELSYNRMNSGKKFGIVFVPKTIPSDSMVIKFNDRSGPGGFFDGFNKKNKE
jgi:PDZ domain